MNTTIKIAALIALLTPALEAQTVNTVVNNGPSSELYDMVILGDGYQAFEQAQFDQDVLDIINYFQTNPDKFPYGAYFQLYNVHTVFRASRESGADKPPLGIYVDTAYDASYWTGNIERCLYINNGGQAAADAALAPDTDGRVIVIVNDSKYGGCAGTYSVSYSGSSMEDVQSHEWGHSFGGLADEYDYGQSGTYTGSEPGQPNITADSSGQTKWPLWLGAAGANSTVGVYEGAGYYRYGLYRGETTCEMRSLNRKFCVVCREAIIKRFHTRAVVLGNPSPAANPVQIAPGTVQTFSFANRIANRPHTIEWRLDGAVQTASGTRFTWDTTGASGQHTVVARLTDTSPDVRSDPQGNLVHEHTWNVDLSSCGSGVRHYGHSCPGSGTFPPMITVQGVPRIPGAVTIYLSTGPQNQPVILMVGLSDQLMAGGVSLPFDLGAIGMPNCSLYQSWDISLPLSTDNHGTSQLTLPIPDDPTMNGGKLYFEWFCIDPPANTFGATTSSAVELTMCH